MAMNTKDAIVAARRTGFPLLRRMQSALDQLDAVKPVGVPFDPSDMSSYSDVRLVALANEYDKSVLLGEQQLREVERQIEGLKRANKEGQFLNAVERRLYADLVHNAEVIKGEREMGLRKMYQLYNEVMDEVRLRKGHERAMIGGAFEYCVVSAAVHLDDDDGYEGIDSLEELRAEFAETDQLAPIGRRSSQSRLSQDQKQVLEDHRRKIRGVRSDLERKKKLRSKVQRFLTRKNLSPKARAEGEELLRDVKNAVANKEREITLLRRHINEISREAPPRFSLRKKKTVDQLPSVPTHVIKGRAGFEDDDMVEPIGVNLKTWAKDKTQDYKARVKKYTGPGAATGDDGMTVRQKEERRRKDARRRTSEVKRGVKKSERERKAGKKQAERAARGQRREGVRAARREERALRKTVKKRTSAQTRAAKKEFDAARRRFQAQTKQAKQAARKELKQARQQRVKRGQSEKKREQTGIRQARKTFKPRKGDKKEIRRAEKQERAVKGERKKRIKFQRRAERWKKGLHEKVDSGPPDSGPAPPDALVSEAPYPPSGQDIAEGLLEAAHRATFGPDPEDDDDVCPEDDAVDAILGHLPPEWAEDDEMVRMVEGYVGAWVSAAIGSECCDVASALGLSTAEVRDIRDMHADDIAARIGDGELADRWLDFHHVNAGLVATTDEEDSYYDPDGDHAFAAEQLLIGVRGTTYDGTARYTDPYTVGPPHHHRRRRQYYLPDHARRVSYVDEYEMYDPRGARYDTVDPHRYYADDVDVRVRGIVPRPNVNV